MRTRFLEKTGLTCLREPVSPDYADHGKVKYKPFMSHQMGMVGGWPIKHLLHAFTWHSIRGTFPTSVELPGCSPKPISKGHWPDSGFEEWFLTVVMYPRLAPLGLLSFVPNGFHSSLLLLDIEYATWANPKSELVIFPVGSCCGPAWTAAPEEELAALPA